MLVYIKLFSHIFRIVESDATKSLGGLLGWGAIRFFTQSYSIKSTQGDSAGRSEGLGLLA